MHSSGEGLCIQCGHHMPEMHLISDNTQAEMSLPPEEPGVLVRDVEVVQLHIDSMNVQVGEGQGTLEP